MDGAEASAAITANFDAWRAHQADVARGYAADNRYAAIGGRRPAHGRAASS